MEDKTKAILYILLSALSFSCMSAMVKLAGDIPTFQKLFFRSSVALVVLFFWVRKQRLPFWGARRHQPYLLGRAVLGTAAMFLFFWGINRIYLADASMISRLNPFFVTLLAFLFLKEKLSRIQIPALIAVFGAALLIIKPEFDFDTLPALAILGGALLSAGGHTLLRALKGKELPPTIIFYFSAVSSVLSLPFAIAQFQMPHGLQWLYLIAIGLLAVLGQVGLTNAYRFEKASEISLYNYTSIVFSAIIGYLIWDEVSDFYSIIGGIVIVSISVFVFFYNRHQQRKARRRQQHLLRDY